MLNSVTTDTPRTMSISAVPKTENRMNRDMCSTSPVDREIRSPVVVLLW